MRMSDRLRDPMFVDEEWLSARVEEPVDPDLPIVDAHHHAFWNAPMRYRIEDLLADVEAGHDVRATVFVEGGEMHRTHGPEHLRTLGETEFVNGMAAVAAAGRVRPRICAGIVGLVDLTAAAAEEALAAHVAAAGGRFRGIRANACWNDQSTANQGMEGLLGRPDFRAGYALLGKLGLTCDVVCFHPQLADVADLAAAFPDTVIVLDHFGGPLAVGGYAERRVEAMADWRDGMRALARRENVVVKLGGLANPYFQDINFRHHDEPPTSDLLAASLKPFVDPAIDLFGPGRCMFESNFPVDKPTAGYVNLWNAFKKLTTGFGRAEREALFSGTATRVYALDDEP
jgi:predicted TIM-barrel fold metal-dependent hydrolase